MQCDLTQPECYKCIRLGRKCPEYRDKLDLLFCNEYVDSYKRNAGRDRARINMAEHGIMSHDEKQRCHRSFFVSHELVADFTNQPEAVRATCCFTASRDLPESWETHAIPLVLSQFSSLMGSQQLYRGTSFLMQYLQAY